MLKTAFKSILFIAAAGFVIWQTGLAIYNAPQFRQEEQRVHFDDWINQSRIHAATSRALLSERMRSLDPNTNRLETRNEILQAIVEYVGTDDLYVSFTEPLTEDGDSITVSPTIEETEIRESVLRTFNRQSVFSLNEIGLEGRNERLLLEQEQQLEQLTDQVTFQNEMIRGLLRQTGISLARMLGSSEVTDDVLLIEEFGILMDQAGVEAPFKNRVKHTMARISELRRMQDVLRSTPLALPLNRSSYYRMTSGYGMRIDPFTFSTRHHNGLDFVSYRGASVLTTAPGTVTYAGVKNGYGNVVYVDHGNGFATRYAHLESISVRVGQVLNLGDQVGRMGSTGRSTGTHLHYEIWFRGRPINPLAFVQTGRQIYI